LDRSIKNRSIVSIVLIILLLAGMLFSCSSRQEVYLESDRSGNVSFTIELEPFLITTMQEMVEFFGENEEISGDQFFNLDEIKLSFNENPQLDLKSVSSPTPEILTGEFAFTDAERVFDSQEALTTAGIITFSKQGGATRMDISLSLQNFAQIVEFFPGLNNPLMEMFGPLSNEGITEEEYLEMMVFAFDEEASPGIMRSSITTTVNVKGEIISQAGGTVKGNTVTYEIPLIRVLLLDEPLEYSLTFK
jgi:hypothetical protein